MPKPNAHRGVAGTVTVTLEDHGQDFTEFDIDLESMRITDVRPYQAWLWKDAVIANGSLRRGDRLRLRTKHAAPNTEHVTLRYPIDQVGPVALRGSLL